MLSRIAIIGGGPGGLMLARLLQRRGMDPVVFESDAYPDERPQGGSLDLHPKTGLRAIRLAALEDAFQAEARFGDQGDRLYDPAGTLLFDRDGLADNRPEIDRSALRRILLDSLMPDTVRWGSRIEAIREADGGYEVAGKDAAARFAVVVGADGAWSRVRRLLTAEQPLYEGVTLVEFGYDRRRHPSVDALVGAGKMFAVGENRVLIAQRNGHGHIRGYAGLPMPESAARSWTAAAPEDIRRLTLEAFAGWAPSLRHLIEAGDLLAVRPLHALPVGHHWATRPGITLLGDAAHLMSPFSGEGVNLALADAVDLADALASEEGWPAVARCEAAISARAAEAAAGAAEALRGTFSPNGLANVLAHYRERVADQT